MKKVLCAWLIAGASLVGAPGVAAADPPLPTGPAETITIAEFLDRIDRTPAEIEASLDDARDIEQFRAAVAANVSAEVQRTEVQVGSDSALLVACQVFPFDPYRYDAVIITATALGECTPRADLVMAMRVVAEHYTGGVWHVLEEENAAKPMGDIMFVRADAVCPDILPPQAYRTYAQVIALPGGPQDEGRTGTVYL